MTFVESALRVFAVLSVIIIAHRLFGLRSFSKLSGFDFAVTVALGSVLASAATATDTSVWVPVSGVICLFLFQAALAPLRTRLSAVETIVDNAPLLVMEDGRILTENLVKADMTHADLMAKLREANVQHFDKVRAVVVETTGGVSVMHGDHATDTRLLAGVQR